MNILKNESRKLAIAIFVTIGFLVTGSSNYSQAQEIGIPKKVSTSSNVLPLQQKPTTTDPSLNNSVPKKSIEQNYQEILEKTNSQLSLWWNPYAVIVAALAALFTILTIVAVYIIYRQSKDYKDKLNEDREEFGNNFKKFLDEQKKLNESFIEARKKAVEDVEKNIDQMLDEQKKKLAAASAEQKAEIQKVINELRLEKATLQTRIGPTSILSGYPQYTTVTGATGTTVTMSGAATESIRKCSNCGHTFNVPTRWLTTTGTPVASTIGVSCPICGTLTIV